MASGSGGANPRVLIVGAGLTGALLWRLLRPLASRMDVEVWDKASAVGGRASTSRVGREGHASADLGMQCVCPPSCPRHVRLRAAACTPLWPPHARAT
jgi:predicted NAD/FAD-dependent oxidoreductase